MTRAEQIERALREAFAAVEAAHRQTDAEFRDYDRTADKAGAIIRAWRDAATEALALPAGGEVPMETTAWLIEWPQSINMVVRWWHPEHGWVIDANNAQRFSRREDAQASIDEMRFGVGAVPTEHKWIGGDTLLSASPSQERGTIVATVASLMEEYNRAAGLADNDQDKALNEAACDALARARKVIECL